MECLRLVQCGMTCNGAVRLAKALEGVGECRGRGARGAGRARENRCKECCRGKMSEKSGAGERGERYVQNLAGGSGLFGWCAWLQSRSGENVHAEEMVVGEERGEWFQGSGATMQ